MKNTINIIVILLSLATFSSCNSQKNSIEGKISGLGNDTIYVQYAPLSKFYEIDELEKDTIISKHGKFTYNIENTKPIIIFLTPKKSGFTEASGRLYYPRQKHIQIVLNPKEKININGHLERFCIKYKMNGSNFNEQFSQLRERYINKTYRKVFIELQLDSLDTYKDNKSLRNKLISELKEINSFKKTEELKYIRKNLNNDLSAFLLLGQKLDTIGKYYKKLNIHIKEGRFKNMLEYGSNRFKKYTKFREAELKIKEGKFAPDFTLKTSDDSNFTLSSIKNKYIVLDFWGSWCGYCIKGFPEMKKYHNKYKNKVEFISIACNDTPKKWKEAVKKNKLNWLQLINKEDIDHDVVVMYAINAYPTKIILDKNKKIIGIFRGESEAFYKKLDEIMK